jgi:hypothetical protein
MNFTAELAIDAEHFGNEARLVACDIYSLSHLKYFFPKSQNTKIYLHDDLEIFKT